MKHIEAQLNTRKDFDSEEGVLIAYKGRDRVEKRISTLKSTVKLS